MIKSIVNLRQSDTDEITFDVIADESGANEPVSMTVNGKRFETFVEAEPNTTAAHAIRTDAVGTVEVMLYAENTGISSDSITVHFAEPTQKDDFCKKCGKAKRKCVCR